MKKEGRGRRIARDTEKVNVAELQLQDNNISLIICF